jgi:hypothetical protein
MNNETKPMTKKEIEQGNKLIAKFMGLKIGDAWQVWNGHADYSKDADFEYHSSWDWLMPVVEKIFKETNDDVMSFNGLVLFEYGICASIEDVWKGVIQFIQWYNQQKQKS